MTARSLAAVDARPDQVLEALPGALDGSGPALVPLPGGPARERVRAMARPDLPLERDDVAVVLATSGSTGEQKGVLLTGAALLHSSHATVARLGGPGQWLLALPVNHVAGLQVLVRALLSGVPPVLLDPGSGFSVEAFVAATGRLDPTRRHYTALVPTQLRRLLDARVDLSSYDAVLVGGAALPFATPAGVVRTYGMTETCGGCVYDGRPLDAVDVAVEEGGRITVGGPVVFAGYRLRADLTSAALVDGRHVTRDIGSWTTDGRLAVVGRIDDVIVTGGVNVAAAAVERAVSGHPAVAAVAVVGVADAEWGEQVVAVLQPSDPAEAPDVDQLREFLASVLEPAALPRRVVLVRRLPMLASGKADKEAVRSLVAGCTTT